MASTNKQTQQEDLLKLALNPIGSVALLERMEKNASVLTTIFDMLSPAAVTLTLSPCGYRLVECFLNANNGDIDVCLGEVFGKSRENLEQLMLSLRGRHVCQTLLNRGLQALAHAAIKLTPADWWFSNTDSLPILIKAIEIADLTEAKVFIADDNLVDNLVETAEGLYCVLKTMQRSIDEPGFTKKFESMVVRISKIPAGVNSLKDVIVYGDILASEMINIIFSRRESYAGVTNSLIIWIIRNGSEVMREIICTCLCSPHDFPLICSLRSSSRFDALMQENQMMFAKRQRERLEVCLAAHPIEEKGAETMGDSAGVETLKRKRNQQATEVAMVKKPREEVVKSPPLPSTPTVSSPTQPTVSTVPSAPTESVAAGLPPTVSSVSPSTVSRTVAISSSGIVVSTVSSPALDKSSVKPKVSLSTVSLTVPLVISSLTTVPQLPTPNIPATVTRAEGSGKNVVPPAKVIPNTTKSSLRPNIDPGKDIVAMAMTEEVKILMKKLESGTVELRSTIFNCVRGGIMALMMNENGSQLVHWFLSNGKPVEKAVVERKIIDNLGDLVECGGYGRSFSRRVIDQCEDGKKKKELEGKYKKALSSPPSGSPSVRCDSDDKIEIMSETIVGRPMENNNPIELISSLTIDQLKFPFANTPTISDVNGIENGRGEGRSEKVTPSHDERVEDPPSIPPSDVDTLDSAMYERGEETGGIELPPCEETTHIQKPIAVCQQSSNESSTSQSRKEMPSLLDSKLSRPISFLPSSSSSPLPIRSNLVEVSPLIVPITPCLSNPFLAPSRMANFSLTSSSSSLPRSLNDKFIDLVVADTVEKIVDEVIANYS